jgi:hypothetical protein
MAPNAFGIKRTTAGAQASPPSFSDLLSEFDTEIRKNITESANWIPEFVIEGTSNFTFKLPDNIGEWTIRVVGTYESWGQIQSIAIKTFLPFFIEFDISEPIRQDDILSVKAYVYNYLGATVEAYVAIESPNLPV